MSNRVIANTLECYVKVLEGLQIIRQRLVENGATPETLSLVDTIIWVSIGLISGQWDSAWLVWPLIGGGVLVLGLWSTREWDRRMRLSVLDRDP